MDKWTRKYLKLAKTLADDNTACHSRKIGVVLVSDRNRIISLGYNGTAEGVPHPDSKEYLGHLWTNLMTEDDKCHLKEKREIKDVGDFISTYAGSEMCPRRMLDIPSGERLDLCPCAHAERNALASANQSGVSTIGSTMYCYCGVPCHECAVQIIQAGLSKVVCLEADQDYSKSSRGLFSFAGVDLERVHEEHIYA